MNSIEIKVKNCRKCPFVEAEFDGEDFDGKMILKHANCYAPVNLKSSEEIWIYKVDSYWKSYKIPKFCPLKDKELIIKAE